MTLRKVGVEMAALPCFIQGIPGAAVVHEDADLPALLADPAVQHIQIAADVTLQPDKLQVQSLCCRALFCSM